MMRRRRHAKYPPGAGAAGGDTDALQTDVMRFMSIIGLCLMAVFALVQGIPVQEKAKHAQSSQARLRQEVRVQQLQVQELQTKLLALKSQMLRTQRVLTVAEQRLEEAASRSQTLREERARLEANVATLERRLDQGRRELRDIEQASMQEQQNLAGLRGRLLKVKGELERSREEIASLKLQSRQKTAAVAISTPPPAPVVDKPAPERQGFILRFVSEDALDRLVAAGSVTLYAMADKQAWRLSMDAGSTAVARASYPGWFHEMSAATVPVHYLQGLARTPDGPAESAVVWGVQLPVTTREAIASLTRGRQGGELVIRGDGQVTLGE